MTDQHTETAAQEGIGPRLLMVLALLAATAPLSTDLYLASFPEVKDALHTDAASVQLTLTAFLIGLGVGQVLWGPVADRYGRLRPLLIGTVVCAIAAATAVFAPSIGALIAARFVQALGGAAGVVISRAIIADRMSGYASARVMSLMMTITGAAPVIAPVIGGSLAGQVSWRGILGIVLAVAVLQLIGVATTVRETLPAARRTARLSLGHLGRLLARRGFLGHAAAVMFTFGTMMSYISSSSFVYQGVIGTSSLVYGLCFALNATGLTLGGWVSSRLAARRVHPARTVGRALPVLVVASALVLVVAAAPVTPWLLIAPILVAVSSVGFCMGNLTALALEHSRDVAGSGSALAGGLMFLFGGVVSPLAGLAGTATAVPLGVVMLCSSGLALTVFILVRRHVARHPHLEAALTR